MSAKKDAEQFLTRAQIEEIIYLATTQTAQVARLASGIVNDVLGTELVTIGTQGRMVVEFGAAAGSIMVTHHGPSLNPVVVQAGTPVGDSAPSNGRAMGRINAFDAGTLALTGHVFTIWATAGDQVTVEAFTSCVPPDKSTGAGGARAPLSPAPLTAPGSGTIDILPLIAAGYTAVDVEGCGGGGGGGSGRRGAAGTVRCGGGGGGAGAFMRFRVTLAQLLAAYPTGLVPYTVAAGGLGGAAVAVDDTNGNPGLIGGFTQFGPFICAGSNSAAGGGTINSGTGGGAVAGSLPGQGGATASTTGGVGGNIGSFIQGTVGGGAGGGITAADVPNDGGYGGGSKSFTPGTAGVGGTVGGAGPATGTTSSIAPFPSGGGGGGGAASILGVAQSGAAAAANTGAGGGGGGAALNGNNSGAGGPGGSGFIRYTVS